MNQDLLNLVNGYMNQSIIGWKGYQNPTLVKESFNLIKQSFVSLPTAPSLNDLPKKTFLYQVVRKVLNRDILNVNQLIGDCVSWGARNATEYLACCDILIRGDREKYRPVFAPYYYGTGRVYIGGWDNDYSDGSLGSFMAQAVMKYGTLFSDEPSVPTYSANIAKEFGAKRASLDKWKPTAINYLVKSAAKVSSFEELCTAIASGYPATVASDQGFTMQANSQGFHVGSGSWAHQMSITGYGLEPEPYVLIRNSWADSHGRLKDFQTGEDLPIGYLRVQRKWIDRMIAQGETFVYSQYDGFKEQPINKALLMLI